MFFLLLLVTLLVALGVSLIVVSIFTRPIENILKRIISDDISAAWVRYLKFAIVVVGVSAGVRLYEIEKYITPQPRGQELVTVELTSERWTLELYRTIIQALQGIAWMLLVFFVFALIAYVIVRFAETRGPRAP
jgi:hypothetical protein